MLKKVCRKLSCLATGLTVFAAFQAGAQTNRVVDGLAVLYKFEAVGGQVLDLATTNAPLNLSVYQPGSDFSLPGGGFAVNGDTEISSDTAASNMVQACVSSGGFSMEAWIDPNNLTQGGGLTGNALQS